MLTWIHSAHERVSLIKEGSIYCRLSNHHSSTEESFKWIYKNLSIFTHQTQMKIVSAIFLWSFMVVFVLFVAWDLDKKIQTAWESLFPQLSDAWWAGEILAHVELQITASWSDCSSKRKRWIFHCVSQMKETLADMLFNSSPSDGDTALLFVFCSHRPVTPFSASDGESNEISFHISCEFGSVI